MKRVAMIVGFVLATLVMAQGVAYADWAPPPVSKPTPPPPSGSSSGSSGAPKQATVSHCSVYATASSFGLSCLGSGGSGDVTTVKEILGKDPVPTCWDARISDSDLQNIYEYTQNPDAPYHLHNCITGLDLTRSPYSQPGLVLSQQVIEIPVAAPPCPKQPYLPEQTGTCVMTLTGKQHQVVDTFVSRDAQIPDVVVAAYPSSRVRTGVPTAYVDRAHHGEKRTRDYQVGGVTMYAAMDSFAIYPYGPGGQSRTCDGTADVGPSDTPDTKPGACWWTYPKSSNAQPNEVYPFRADATWTVYVNGAAFATFHKYSDLQLPVFDVQTLVVN